MKLKQKGLKLGLALAAVGLLSVQAHAADGFDGAVEPLDLGAALPLVGEVQVAALEQVGSATPLPVAAAAASSSGPLGVEGSAALAAFSQADIATLFEPSTAPLQLAALSEQEMKETEGAVAPLVAIGVMTGSRFIAQRWVTQRVAQRMVQSRATNVMAPTRAIASNIAGRGAIREFHSGSGARHTHFHTATRNGSHVWFGRAR